MNINNVKVYPRALSQAEILLTELISDAKPFTSGDTVDETGGTILLMEQLQETIDKIEKYLMRDK